MATMFSLPYGRTLIEGSLRADALCDFLTPRPAAPLSELAEEVRRAVAGPVAGAALEDFLRHGDKVALIVSDITRYSGAELFLPLVLDQINQAGVPDRDLTIVFATGIHRPMTSTEQRRLVGEEVAGRVALENHDPRDENLLCLLGATRRGTPVRINRRVAEADKVVLTGTIGFHYLAGFGGGRKSILPGVSAYESCLAVHLLVLDPDHKGRHPGTRSGNLEGNPMHEDMMEACTFLPPRYLFNTVLSAAHEIVHLAVGDWQEAFYRGCDFFARHFRVSIPAAADLVITGCGGYPKDINFIQAHKTLEYAINALRPGGVMIAAAACAEGLGHPEFYDWFRYQDPAELEARLRAHFQVNGQTAYAMLLKARRATIFLISELPDEVVCSMGMHPVHCLEEALAGAYAVVGERPSTYVIPDGSIVLPWIETTQ
jgi:lactate racemase